MTPLLTFRIADSLIDWRTEKDGPVESIPAAEGWRRTVEINDDPYGACTVRYTATWASLMEAEMAANGSTTLGDGEMCDRTSHEADTEGITGFMYGAAVAMLALYWAHGEELRRWHNIKTSPKQGAQANASGAVLNPAILVIGDDK